MRPVLIVAGLLFAAAPVSPIPCEPSTSAYVISAIPPNSKTAVCLRLDPYSFTVTGNLVQARTHFVESETPSGAINGINPAFRLSLGAPIPPKSLHLYRNGILQQPGGDYTLVANTITFSALSIPQPGDNLLAFYRF